MWRGMYSFFGPQSLNRPKSHTVLNCASFCLKRAPSLGIAWALWEERMNGREFTQSLKKLFLLSACCRLGHLMAFTSYSHVLVWSAAANNHGRQWKAMENEDFRILSPEGFGFFFSFIAPSKLSKKPTPHLFRQSLPSLGDMVVAFQCLQSYLGIW